MIGPLKGSPKRHGYGVYHQTRDLECFADRKNIPWNLPTIFSSRPDCNSTADVRSFTMRTALFAIPFVSDLCSIDVQRFLCNSSQDLAKFQGFVSVNDFRLAIRLQELLQALLGFLRSFCFARMRLDPLGSQVLHHDCISMIVSKFTTFTENFVICCYQVTKIFCTKYGSANTSSARGPCDSGTSGRSRNFDLSGSEFQHCVHPNPHLSQAQAL